MNKEIRTFSPVVQEVINEFIPICQNLAHGRGRYAISVGGSLGKGTWDSHSDVDFRLFHEEQLPWTDKAPELWKDYFTAIDRWGKQGVRIDGVWCRQIVQIEEAMNRWLDGKIEPQDLVWTIWGYHLLTDIYNQHIIEDRFGVIAGWKTKLKSYPRKLKLAILEKHMGSLRYWRKDYHYANKVERQDSVFLAGLSARLVHDMMQVLFALNEVYFVGDGNNLGYIYHFTYKPIDFEARVQQALYPQLESEQTLDNPFRKQYDLLMTLVDEVENLVKLYQ